MDSKHTKNSPDHDKQPSESFVVKGRVLQPNGTPLKDVLVRILDHDLRLTKKLAKGVRTAEDGRYEIRYTCDQLSRPKKIRADLIVHAYDQKGEKLLATSPLIPKAKPVETVDLVVMGDDYTIPTEYDQLLEGLEPLLVNVRVEGVKSPTIFHKLADLKEDERQREITFLSREMSVEKKHIIFLVLAAKISLETKLPPKVFYGLFRQGLSPHLPNLLSQKLSVIRSTLEVAVRRNLIPGFDGEQELEQILDQFKELRVRHTLENPEQPGKASLGDLLEKTALPQSRGKQEAFLKRYREHQDKEPPEPIEHFWQALRQSDEFKDDIDALQFTLQAGALTQNHLPLVQELHHLRREGKLQTPRDWAKLDVEAWATLIRKQRTDGQPIGFPPDVPGKDDAEKTENYANMMARLIEDSFPTPVIAHRIEQENRPEEADLVRFFRANQDFEFRKISVDAYLERQGQPALAGLENPAAATRTLKNMQRLFKVTPRYAEMRVLLDAGLASAHDITSLGKKTFAELYGGALGGTERALELYSGASQTKAMAMMVWANHSQKVLGTDVAAIAPARPKSSVEAEELLELGIAIPTWEKLFGSLDLCDCEHCRSVYSPAAYLVDILAFLNPKRNTVDQKPLDILYARRPDLGSLDLSCENTNTILPYVDLVNELLENAVAPLPPFIPFDINADLKEDLDNRFLSAELQEAFEPDLSVGATIVVLNPGREWRILDTTYAYSLLDEDPADETLQVVARGWQTYASSEELEANPQYTNPGTYDVLAEAVYPWHLPFDRWITEARTYLDHLGVDRHDLMATFRSQGTTPTPNENAIASEFMGLSPAEWQILTGTSAYPWEYWGYRRSIHPPSHWIYNLSQVSTLLETSGLTYVELLDLLGTRFINPDGSLRIESTDEEDLSTCDLTKLEIVDLDPSVLDRIHRFVRLWRQLGWSMMELDKAIDTLKPIERTAEGLNAEDWADLLRRLSHIQRLKAELKVPVITMLSWWTLIDTVESIQLGKPPCPSLYEERFQNKAVFSSPDDVQLFRLNDTRDQLREPFGSINQTVPAICAGLGISAADLSLLTAGLPELVEDETTADQLNLENVSYLFRVVSLSKALKLSIQDFLTVRTLTGARPLLDAIRITAATPDDARVYPEDTLQWMETLGKIRTSGFKIGELAYLLRCEDNNNSSSFAPSEDTVAQFLTELRDGLQTISDEQTFTADPTGDVTRQKLLLLKWDPALVEDVIAILNNIKIFSVSQADAFPIDLPLPLDDLPLGLEDDEKAALRRKVSLKISEDGTHTLQFQGVMSENEQTALLSLSTETEYETAIGNLFQAPREFVATRMKAFDPTVSAPLEVLPKGIVFPGEFEKRISYDALAQELRFMGVMTESEQEALLDLHGDSEYQLAVNVLFTESNRPLDPVDENAFLDSDGTAELFNEPAGGGQPRNVPERFGYVLEKVVTYLRMSLSRNLIKQMLSDILNLEAATTSKLLTQWVQATTDSSQKAIVDFLDGVFVASQSKLTADGFPAQFLTFKRLHKIATAIAKLDVEVEELAWIFENGPALGWLNLVELPVQAAEPDAPFADWTRLIDGLQVNHQLPSRETTLFDLFDLIQSFTTIDGSAKETFLTALSESTGWDLADIEVLVGLKDDLSDTGLLELIFPDDFQTEKALLVLIPCFRLIRRLGVSASLVSTWIQPGISFENARAIKQTVKAKYDNIQWLQLAKPLRDVLRKKQRAALVDYLVHHSNLWLSSDEIESLKAAGQRPDANKLYACFLLDVEMSPCMMTSRIKQACSSVQLFIQRCLMGLEEGVSLGEEAADEWKWMKNYRVWEANRKVFLYPENWIEPELRDDKTPFFKDLENELQQNEVNEDTVESVFSKYLEKLDTVARLEICGMYHQLEVGQNILHVFGRTEGAAPVYYYRRGVDNSYWTAWEEVNADIVGDHLIPVVHLGRLKLFWPIFTEKQEEAYGSDANPRKWWEIQLAWSEYKNGKWTAKKISSDTEKLVSKIPAEKANYTFKALQWAHNLAILCLRSGTEEVEPGTYVGVFAFTGCRESVLSYGIWDITHDDEANYEGVLINQIPYQLINQDTVPIYEKIVEWLNLLGPDRSQIQNMEFVETASYFEESDDSLNVTRDYYLEPKIKTLEKTPGTFKLLYQHQLHWYQYQLLDWVQANQYMLPILSFLLHFPAFQFLRIPSCFFYQDDFRTFFVIPVTLPLLRLVFEGDGISLEYLGRMPRNYGAESLPISTGDDDISSPGNGINPLINISNYSIWKDQFLSRYLFRVFYHPYLCRFIQVFNRHGIDGLLQRDIQLLSDDFFVAEYEPTEAVVPLYPRDDVDFSYGGAYSQYNWELFFHAPLLIAQRLSSNQQFAEAQRWFHYIFDPTDTSNDSVPKRYWRTRPFYETTDEEYQAEQIRTLLRVLAGESPEPEPGMRDRLEKQVRQWRRNPFNPHLIARLRTTAFQKAVVIKYIDNLIAWGDYLFRQDTIESINEATQLYILAAEILGPRPQKIPARSTPPTRTVDYLVRNPDLDEFSNLLEDALPPAYSASSVSDTDGLVPVSLGQVLYFCVPKNDKFQECWDTVEDRLFKIRHCMNIEGIVRELPLFQPPIEPGLLVKAVAAGIDISSVLNDMNAPLPYYRCQVMLQKALELCNDVKALGGALLSALEKRDGEALALLRSSHEMALLDAVRVIKESQVDEAKESLESTKKSRELVRLRKTYYGRLLTNSPTLTVGGGEGSDDAGITIKPLYPMNEFELLHLSLSGTSLAIQAGQAATDLTAGISYLIPDLETGAPTTMGATIGGSNVGQSAQAFGKLLGNLAAMLNAGASLAATMGSYKRRAEEWDFQKQLAGKELEQFEQAGGRDGPQIIAAMLRLAIAEKDLENHDLQIENASDVDTYMRDKFTNQELYGWMVGQIATVYYQTYKLAYDLAKRVEKSYRYELGLDDSNFIQFGYWDSMKKGLLAGERLHHDLKRLETAYLSQNKREYEITKSISLALMDPVALFHLKQTGECFFSLSEALFDMDYPGHYFRRIRNISLSIPCVAGPYMGVSATLTLQGNRIRKKTSTSPQYSWTGDFNDDRFNYNLGGIQSIATSSGQNDSGLFELNFHDERYLPFEGAGVISTWRIQLPRDFRQFDYDTISDVVVHIRYTAREGGDALKRDALEELRRLFEESAAEVPLIRAFSVKHEFPNEWHQFLHPNPGADHHSMDLRLHHKRFPYQFNDKTIEIRSMQVFLQLKEDWKIQNEFEYEDGDALSILLRNPEGVKPYADADPELTVGGSPIAKIPFAVAFQGNGQGQSPGTWRIEIPGADIEDDTENRRDIPRELQNRNNPMLLNPDAIDDLIIVCYYSVT